MSENLQTIALRVYYEDTDFSGRVYHAAYLRFFERGRTEWLRKLGFSHNALAAASQTTFAVTKLAMEFAAAASIDDLLDVETELRAIEGAVLKFRQRVARDGVTLVQGEVDIVAIRANRAVRPPHEILATLRRRDQSTPESP